jgi:CRP-like cAMP-binding protein
VVKDAEIIAEGELADCFWIVQEGSCRFKQSSADSNTEGQGEIERGLSGVGGASSNGIDSECDTNDGDSIDETPAIRRRNTRPGPPRRLDRSREHLSPRQARKRGPVKIRKGDSFGEVALLYNVPRARTVVASEDCVLWGIDRKNFQDILMGLEEEQLQRYMQYMKTVPTLVDLQDDEKHELAQALVEMHFTKNDHIAVQGECPDQCHILFEGEVSLMRYGKEEQRLRAGYPENFPQQQRVETQCCLPFFCNRDHLRRSARDLPPILCYSFGDEALRAGTVAHTWTIKVVSETAKTMALLKESFDMLIGDIEKLDRVRNLRTERRLSLRGAVQLATLEDVLKTPLQSRYSKTGQVPSNTLRKVRGLGSGAFGDVELWRARDMKLYALKIMSKGHIMAMNAQKNVINERNVMLMTSSPFIVRLYEVYNSPSYLYFLMEFVDGGELYTVYNRLGLHGKTKYAKFYTANVVCAFEHLHKLHIIYRLRQGHRHGPRNLCHRCHPYILWHNRLHRARDDQEYWIHECHRLVVLGNSCVRAVVWKSSI